MPEGASSSSGSGDARPASQEARSGEVIPMDIAMDEVRPQGDTMEPKARSFCNQSESLMLRLWPFRTKHTYPMLLGVKCVELQGRRKHPTIWSCSQRT
eukprot:4193452-Amphidinium_carterae.2